MRVLGVVKTASFAAQQVLGNSVVLISWHFCYKCWQQRNSRLNFMLDCVLGTEVGLEPDPVGLLNFPRLHYFYSPSWQTTVPVLATLWLATAEPPAHGDSPLQDYCSNFLFRHFMHLPLPSRLRCTSPSKRWETIVPFSSCVWKWMPGPVAAPNGNVGTCLWSSKWS